MKMAKKKKRHNGHYCKICGCRKSNESFTGKGHARHICKECQSLPKDEQADMMRCNEVERAAFRFPMRRQDWELLEKYAKKYKDMGALLALMSKLEVMYAWEHGFEKKEVH